jgi:hypothetical protein
VRRGGLVIVALAACGNPPALAIDFALSPGPSQVCTTTSGQVAQTCSDVTMRCDATLSVRIVAPNDPTTPYVSLCQPITGRKDLCSIAEIPLAEPSRPIPATNLEIQVAIYPTSALCSDANDPTGLTKLCPTDVGFDDSTGLPINFKPPCDPTKPCDCPPLPSIGGRAWYHPGDKLTVVDLGCTDLRGLDDPACTGPSTVTVAATVNDFDTGVSVSPSIADTLGVSVGEPHAILNGTTTEFVLEPTDTQVLPRTVAQPVPGWGAEVSLAFQIAACLDVLEDAPQSTATLSCKAVTGTPRIDITGVRVAKPTLDQILGALGATTFPARGLVVGVVLDYTGNPIAGATVATSNNASIEYLSPDRSTIVLGATTSNGIFLSKDAQFGTTFSTTNSQLQTATGFGGVVDGKVTVVVVQFVQPPNM